VPATAPRSNPRVLNYGTGPPKDGLEREWDTCPICGLRRWQLIIVPDRFHCDKCEKAGPGPNTEVAEPEPVQIDFFESTEPAPTLLDPTARAIASRAHDALTSAAEEWAPPIDEADAWMAEEMPDE
jgi:hypothetical protein